MVSPALRGAGPRPRLFATALALGAVAFIAGCGGDGEGDPPSGDVRPPEGGALSYALAGDPLELDPLLAADRASQIVTRQIHEPLVESLSGPFGDVRELPGLARSSSASSDATIWRFRLRPRVRFHDGTPFNASAVLANADRWLASEARAALLPDLAAVDAPRPDLVRFILSQTDLGFPARLAHPRLGIVSPRALRGRARVISVQGSNVGTGTGAFELRERKSDGTVVLARNLEWWGTRFDLGPALDQLVFPIAREPDERVALLARGQVEVADALTPRGVSEVRSDPLLAVEAGGEGPPIGIERSVRGIDSEIPVPVLSGAWLTTVGAGE